MLDSLFVENALKRIIPGDKVPRVSYGDLLVHDDEVSEIAKKVSEYGYFYATDPAQDTFGPRDPITNWLVCNTRRVVSAIYSKPHMFFIDNPAHLTWLEEHKRDYTAQRALGDAIRHRLLFELLPPGAAIPVTHSGAWELLQPFERTLSRPYPPTHPTSSTVRTHPTQKIHAVDDSHTREWVFPGAEDDWVVAHFGPLKTWDSRRDVTQLLSAYAPYRNALSYMHSPHWTRIPKLIQLLLIALGKSQGQVTGWTEWGILWTAEGLFFDYGRALKTALTHADCRGHFNQIAEDNYLTLWKSPLYYAEKSAFLKGKKLETFTDIFLDCNYALIKALRPFERFGYIPGGTGKLVSTQLETDEEFELRLQGAEETDLDESPREKTYVSLDNACLFKLAHGPCNLTEYLKFLDKGLDGKGPEISRAQVRHSPHSIMVKPNYQTREAAPTEHQHVKVRTFTLSAFELGWMDRPGTEAVCETPRDGEDRHSANDLRLAEAYEDAVAATGVPEKLGLQIIKRADTYYISAPVEIFEQFPELVDRRMFLMVDGKLQGYRDEVTHKVYRLHSIPKWHTHKGRAASVRPKDHGITYFHPECLAYPNGLFWQVLDALGRTEATKMAILDGPRRAFRSFCYWLHNPVAAANVLEVAPEIADKISLGDELLMLCSSTHSASTYPGSFPPPVDLDTLDKRLEFFYDKAECQMPYRRLFRAITQEDGTVDLRSINESRYSKRMSSYDRWVIWYVLNIELPKLNRRFTRVQIAKYLALRWMPWRRAGGLMLYLKGPNGRIGFDTAKGRIPQPATDVEVVRWAEHSEEVYKLTGLGIPYSTRG